VKVAKESQEPQKPQESRGRDQCTLAERLDCLFRTVRANGGREHTYEEVANAIRSDGVSISHTYIWQLRKGIRDNPTKRHLEALAAFFGVPAAYFLDDEVADRIQTQLDLLAAMRDQSVRSIALRSAGLSPGSLRAIQGMIEHVRALEGLPDDPP
jgi:ESX-1-secreted protein regulator